MTCERCGKAFERRPRGAAPRYCSVRCRRSASYARRAADINARKRARYAADPKYRQKALAASAATKARDPEKARRYVRDWHKRHGGNKDYKASWRSENREKVRAYSRRDARQRRVLGTDDGVAYALLLERDPCCYCGGPGGEVDHIVAVKHGGDGDWPNLTAACRSCNARKHARPLLTFLHERAIR